MCKGNSPSRVNEQKTQGRESDPSNKLLADKGDKLWRILDQLQESMTVVRYRDLGIANNMVGIFRLSDLLGARLMVAGKVGLRRT